MLYSLDKDFIHDYMWHPFSKELPIWKQLSYLVGTVSLGILTLGSFHLVVSKLNKREVKPDDTHSISIHRIRHTALSSVTDTKAQQIARLHKQIAALQREREALFDECIRYERGEHERLIYMDKLMDNNKQANELRDLLSDLEKS